MGLDYALVHAKYTIPPALLLTFLYRPLFTRRDVYRIVFLITIAVVSTIPWDSYLIRSRIWTYPSYAILGPTFFQIPLEELFFFFIQTYDVSLLYMIYSKATFYPAYLPRKSLQSDGLVASLAGTFGQILLWIATVQGARLIEDGGPGTYLGLIVSWSFPFLLLLWSLSHSFALRIPPYNILVPVVVPTVYLWMVDTFSLKRGTWVIENGTKLGVHLWDGLEIEEAFFFLATNLLIVFGQIAFDNAVAVVDSFPGLFPGNVDRPSPVAAVRALFTPIKNYDSERVLAFEEAIGRLKSKSRSFYLASAMFEGRLRIDLVLLYSFCRVADDLVDNSKDSLEAQMWVNRLRKFLDVAYKTNPKSPNAAAAQKFIESTFPEQSRRALLQLPVSSLSSIPLYDLLKGFDMDLSFSTKSADSKWPIADSAALELYGSYVAGTVAELCCDLVFVHHGANISDRKRRELKQAASKMGIALQTVNIARDIKVDSAIGRVYIPTDWLSDQDLSPEDVLQRPALPKMKKLRSKLLAKAFAIYDEARPAIEELPEEVRGPMRVAIESYMEIGRVLKDEDYLVTSGRATVPRLRRTLVAWRALYK